MLRSLVLKSVVAMFAVVLAGTSLAGAAEPGFTSLFDGKTLDGWEGNPKLWSVRDGTITGQTTKENPTKGNTFLIWRQGEVDDFELRLEYRMVGGNSGVQYRSKDHGNWVVGGYQGDFEAGKTYSGILYEERGRGVLAQRGQKVVIDERGKKNVVGSVGDSDEIQASIKNEDWNSYTIIARGNHLIHKINNKVSIDVTDNQKARRAMSGILALQLHAGPPMLLQFRNIRIKRLPLTDGRKKIVLVAGRRSHGYGSHEHKAGCMLLADALNENVPNALATVYADEGWPKDPTAFDNADAIVMFCDGGGGHYVNRHLEQTDKLMKKGVGLACLHYGVEVPKGDSGNALLDWIGGYFEAHWSVNPHWTAEFKKLPDHPITRGVEPFSINDEWYYHMRFREGMSGVTPILTAVPPASTLSRKDGAHSGNPHVRKTIGQPQHVAWAATRPDGGRGFGLTGAHYHWNWGHDDFRKLTLNAIVWTAGLEVPEGGVPSKSLTVEDLQKNQDYKPGKNFNPDQIRERLEKWNQ